MAKSRIIFITSIFVLLVSFNSFGQQSDSVRIGNLVVAGRNLGVDVPKGGVALNYTNDNTHADHKNLLFKGDYYTWEEAKTACLSSWRLPTKAELEVINSKMKFSNGTAYLEDGDGNKCYFPLSGKSSSPSYVRGDYWSCTENNSSSAWYLSVSSSSSNVCGSHKSNGLAVRCVKTVE